MMRNGKIFSNIIQSSEVLACIHVDTAGLVIKLKMRAKILVILCTCFITWSCGPLNAEERTLT